MLYAFSCGNPLIAYLPFIFYVIKCVEFRPRPLKTRTYMRFKTGVFFFRPSKTVTVIKSRFGILFLCAKCRASDLTKAEELKVKACENNLIKIRRLITYSTKPIFTVRSFYFKPAPKLKLYRVPLYDFQPIYLFCCCRRVPDSFSLDESGHNM